MNKGIKKIMTLVLLISVVSACFFGCGKKAETDKEAGFTIRVGKPNANMSDEMWKKDLERIASWSDVPITWEYASAADGEDTLSLKIAAGDYPDIILGNSLNASKVSQYSSNGILIPLDEYITKENTPNLWEMFEKNPKTKAANYLPDGKMYSLPQLIQYGPNFLERVIYINKVWLDKLGLEVPKTTDEVIDVLRAFKKNDPNGNGKADEIPLSFMVGHAYSCPEAMLSAWGYSTKSGTFDSYTTVKDGKVSFAPMLDEWKLMVEFYRTLYKEGLLDMEAFTHTAENFIAKTQSTTSKIGMIWSRANPMANADEYVAIAPIHAEGYEAVWHIHPGIIGNRNVFSITNACKNPKAAMRWIDHFYDTENSLQFEYGLLGYALDKDDSGKYVWNEPPEGTPLSTYIAENRPMSSVPCYISGDVFKNKLEENIMMKEKSEVYEIYKPYVTSEPWPRPYYSFEDISTLSELQTDIFKFVDEKFAKWVVGSEDVGSGWNDYIKNLKKIGVDKLVEINQKAYDSYVEKMK